MRGEVRAQPALLDRPGAARDSRAVRVERDQVPAPDVVAVVAAAPRARRPVRRARSVEVVEVPAPGALVVAEDRTADRLDPSPRRLVDGARFAGRRAVVLDVAERKHGGEPGADQQVGGRPLAAARAGPVAAVVAGVVGIAGDVAGRGDHRVRRASAVPRPQRDAAQSRRPSRPGAPPASRCRLQREHGRAARGRCRQRPRERVGAGGGHDPVRRAAAHGRRGEVVERREAGRREGRRGGAREVDRAEHEVIRRSWSRSTAWPPWWTRRCPARRTRPRPVSAATPLHSETLALARSARREVDGHAGDGAAPVLCQISTRVLEPGEQPNRAERPRVPGGVGDSRDLRGRAGLDGDCCDQRVTRPRLRSGP